MESLATLLQIFKDYRVERFFSFETREETTFNVISSDGIDKYVTRCEPLIGKGYSEFAIPCLPNLTVIPKNKLGVTLDNKILLNENEMAEFSTEKEDVMKLWIEGVYIGEAYIAAGFLAACQCPEFLKDRFLKLPISKELPGVRYDVEVANNSLHTVSTMPKEITGFINVIKNQINSKNFGFIFASENVTLEGRNITDITVYKTQVTTYLERALWKATSDFKEE